MKKGCKSDKNRRVCNSKKNLLIVDSASELINGISGGPRREGWRNWNEKIGRHYKGQSCALITGLL